MEKQMWMVRAGRGGILIEDFESKNIVAIGWSFLGDMSKIEKREAVAKLIDENMEEYSKGKAQNVVSCASRFRFVLEKGDYILTYNSDERIYIFGRITGDYEFRPDINQEYPHVRCVEWESKIDRDKLSIPTKNTLGSTLTLFQIPEVARDEMLRIASGEPHMPVVDAEDESQDDQIEEEINNLESQAHELIKDKISKLSWDQMEELVAGIIEALGYKTKMTPKGSDLGRDIVASYDGLGLVEPRIIVEVKHHRNRIGTQEIRSFIGGLRPGDKGLYASTGGFSKEARYEAERSNFPITLLDFDDLVDLFEENYDLAPLRFINRAQSFFPLFPYFRSAERG
jgi:restriction system protein